MRYRPVTSAPAVTELRGYEPDSSYLAFHAPRYVYLLEIVEQHCQSLQRVLDIGPSLLTRILHERLGSAVDTLGFEADEPTATGRHYQFDLNQTQDHSAWRTDLPGYDLIIMAEVIEHLYTSPSHVLGFLRSLLNPGGVLIIQTPNAAAFSVRMKLLLGRNPYHLINEDARTPMHFREYTERELDDYARGTGFVVVDSQMRSYFDQRFAPHSKPRWIGTFQNWVYDFMPRQLRTGMTVVLRRS